MKNFLAKELDVFFAALTFYTRIPPPVRIAFAEENLGRSAGYLPLIGWIVGGFQALALWMLDAFLPPTACVIISVVFIVVLTGAFHEDGLSDVCDGFGGGQDKEGILRIMKDSRVGVCGVIGIFLALALKISLTTELLRESLSVCVKAVLIAHVFSRFMALCALQSLDYARTPGCGKAAVPARKLDSTRFCASLLWLLPAFALGLGMAALMAFAAAFAIMLALRAFFKKRIGGYTGDCLGAVQQCAELCSLLIFLALSRR